VVVRDFDFVGITILPRETDAVLIVDADAVLASAVAFQALQPVPGRDRQIRQVPSPIDLIQLSPRDVPQVRGAGRASFLAVDAIEYVLGSLISEGNVSRSPL
jgi:hypothetical protein